MSTERLKRNLSILDVLNKTTKNQRKAFIDTTTRDQLMCICDCATNILNENIPLTPKQYTVKKNWLLQLNIIGCHSLAQLFQAKMTQQKLGSINLI